MTAKCEHAFREKIMIDGRLIEQCEQCGRELMNIDLENDKEVKEIKWKRKI